MHENPLFESSLDDLAALAQAGDEQAAHELFTRLRVRFRAIAKRRVRREDWEDVVQDALRIVFDRHTERTGRQGILVWSLVVLRNVIGNYYQKQRGLDRGETYDERLHGNTAAVRETEGARTELARVLGAIAELARIEPRCGRIFRRILESQLQGGGPREVSQRALARLEAELGGLSRSALYVALHRCRSRLRQILEERDPELGDLGGGA